MTLPPQMDYERQATRRGVLLGLRHVVSNGGRIPEVTLAWLAKNGVTPEMLGIQATIAEHVDLNEKLCPPAKEERSGVIPDAAKPFGKEIIPAWTEPSVEFRETLARLEGLRKHVPCVLEAE